MIDREFCAGIHRTHRMSHIEFYDPLTFFIQRCYEVYICGFD